MTKSNIFYCIFTWLYWDAGLKNLKTEKENNQEADSILNFENDIRGGLTGFTGEKTCFFCERYKKNLI